jgi:sirohydrochlorin ferrochelatase
MSMLVPEGTTPDGRTLGVILVDHGSRLAAANEMLLEVATLFRRVTGQTIVEPAHMELAEPSIERAFEACVAQGAQVVVVHPYFLSPGRHSTTDIPRLVGAAAARHPGVAFHVTQPLGLSEHIAAVIQERISECLANGLSCAACASRTCAASPALAPWRRRAGSSGSWALGHRGLGR